MLRSIRSWKPQPKLGLFLLGPQLAVASFPVRPYARCPLVGVRPEGANYQWRDSIRRVVD